MNSKMLQNRDRQLREVAILVASLDERWAKRLVESMPLEDAAAVREAVGELGPLDPDEQRAIVEKFRRSTEVQHPTQVDGVELDASLLARFEEQDHRNAYSPPTLEQRPLDTLNQAETTSIAHLLSGEHPQTIAIVFSRINPAKTSELLANFSPTMQADVLTRMANCDSADEQTVQVVEAQLATWIDQHRMQKQRVADGLDLVQRILESSPEAQRNTLLPHLEGRIPSLAGKFAAKPKQASDQHTVTPIRDVTRIKSSDYQRQKPPSISIRSEPVEKRKTFTSADPQRELEQLEDATLLAALARTDRQVVMLALAGAGEALMKRVLRGLPRREASKLRRQLRDIGPTRLSDMLTAQQELLQSAYELTGQRRTSSVESR